MATKNKNTYRMAQLGILLALVIVLQSLSSFNLVSVCLCLVPLTLGAMLHGISGGLALGLAFGLITLFWGLTGGDAFTAALLQVNPFMTVVICLVKAVATGLAVAFVYKLICNSGMFGKYKKTVAAFTVSILAPIVNTGLFLLGCLIIKQDATTVVGSLTDFIVTVVLVNFSIEMAINVVFAPVINKLAMIWEKQYGIRKAKAPRIEEKSENSEK